MSSTEVYLSGLAEEILEAFEFGLDDGAAGGSDAVVAPPLIIGGEFRRDFGDQAGFEEAADGGIESAGGETEAVPGAGGNLLDDGVAVSVGGRD